MEQVPHLSRRTMKIISLAKAQEETSSKTIFPEEKSSMDKISEGNDTISNLIIETEPQILQEIFDNVQDLNNTTEEKDSENIDEQKKDNEDIFSKIISSDEKENKRQNIQSQSDKTHCPKRNNISSECISKTNKTKYLNNKTEKNLKTPEFAKPITTSVNVGEIYDDIHLPLIIVPPKESVVNFPIESDLDLPIIFEIPSSTESYITCDKRNENLNLNCDLNNLSVKTGIKNASVSESKTSDDSHTALDSPNFNETDIGTCEDEVERTVKSHYKDKKTFCFFCEKDVSHFSRHLSTWHKDELEVQRLHSFKSKSKERRQALKLLGNRGNYVKNRSNVQLRPVRRVQSGIPTSLKEFLPCAHCLGFYKKKSLYRHTKTCASKPSSTQGKRQSSQSDGQTALLLGKFKHDQLLEKELFPRMRADDVTLTARKDSLICSYAYSYIKGRKSKGNLDFVRTSVRNLAKLSQHAAESNQNIKGLIDLLRPTLFKEIIRGVNIIGGYNEKNDMYESPTVALNFGTLLKKCCDLAIIQLLQENNTEAQRKEIKILKTLIESQWANEVSAQASLNLNSKKWNKEELLPLTSDLKKLKEYLEKSALGTYQGLKENERNKIAYSSLKEVLYCQIILMNRRRPAEVAQIKVETYKSINLDIQENEFEECLTETEKILLNSCSRMVIRGKRGRGVPILLTQNMKQQFDLIIKVRDNFVQDNDFIFHTTGKNFIDGTKILYKYAEKCGIQNPKSISATRLRKHLATVTQLLQFSEGDLEQLSKFMGHTLQTHCNFYRLSDSTYQTAKISKLLLLATEGGLEKYKGQDLDSININLNPISEDFNVEDVITEQIPDDSTSTFDDNLEHFLNAETNNKEDSKKCTSAKIPWSLEQKQIIAKYFHNHIKKKKAPTQTEITTFLAEYPGMFEERKWTSIKAVVYNFYTGKLIIPIDL